MRFPADKSIGGENEFNIHARGFYFSNVSSSIDKFTLAIFNFSNFPDNDVLLKVD